jgi:hypothetical protein
MVLLASINNYIINPLLDDDEEDMWKIKNESQ